MLRLFTLLNQKSGLIALSTFHVFLLVARREGTEEVLVRDLVKTTGITQSAVARIIATLGDKRSRSEKPGMGWVVQVPDAEDPRRGRIFTTEAGRQVVAEIEAIM